MPVTFRSGAFGCHSVNQESEALEMASHGSQKAGSGMEKVPVTGAREEAMGSAWRKIKF